MAGDLAAILPIEKQQLCIPPLCPFMRHKSALLAYSASARKKGTESE
jgi:hypothetical protein